MYYALILLCQEWRNEDVQAIIEDYEHMTYLGSKHALIFWKDNS